jgi:D-alanyl-D-alanine carboxypeptidase (penicillin-binding protein 5/6)
LPSVFGVVIILGYTIYLSLQAFATVFVVRPIAISLPPASMYPILENTVSPDISAESAIVMDKESQVVVYSKNISFRFSPASTTKLMTALTGFQYFHPTDILTIKAAYVEPVVVGFQQGQQVRFLDLLTGMLIPSGNDAALAIAQNYPGGEDAFIKQMNTNARAFHLLNTHYGDPIGLTDDETYTTVLDLARLTSIVLANNVIKQIVGTKYATITTVDGLVNFPLKSTNILLGQDGVTGVKTGYTEGAGEVLVSSVERGNHTFIIIVMKSTDRFADTETLIHSVVNAVTFVSIHP